MDSRKEKGAITGVVSLTMLTEAPALNILAAELASTFLDFNLMKARRDVFTFYSLFMDLRFSLLHPFRYFIDGMRIFLKYNTQ